MRVFYFIIGVILFATAFAEDEESLPSLQGMQSLSVLYQNSQQLEFLKSFVDVRGFDFAKITDTNVDILVTAENVEYFKQLLNENNMNYTVLIEDVQKNVIEEYITQQVERRLQARVQDSPTTRFPFTFYPDNDEVNEYLNAVLRENVDEASLINIGNSYEGLPMKVLKLSTGGKNKPAIFIDAGIHAREWIAPATALFIIDTILANHKSLLANIDWYILPVLNPDGYHFAHVKFENRMWRKTRSNTGSICRGVDGNRNYDMEWMTTGASSNPCSDTYAGPKPFSEVEMQHMRDFILSRKGEIKAYISLHSYGQYILYPWGFTSKVPSNEGELRNLAISCAKAIAKYRNTKYTYGTSANQLYPAAGGSDDWAMAKANVSLSYTIELPGGNDGFLLPPSEIVPVGIETFEAIKVIHQYVSSKYAAPH